VKESILHESMQVNGYYIIQSRAPEIFNEIIFHRCNEYSRSEALIYCSIPFEGSSESTLSQGPNSKLSASTSSYIIIIGVVIATPLPSNYICEAK
jgi:hypothetical protein